MKKKYLVGAVCAASLFLLGTSPTLSADEKTGWQAENNHWYYYEGNNVKTGWKEINGKWYLLDPTTGEMKLGWQQLGSTWYYLKEDGSLATGWQVVGGKWYLLDATGAMKTNWQQLGNHWYYLGQDGAMRTGWQLIQDSWFYLDETGLMKTNWQMVNGKWYFFQPNGNMLTGWQVISGNWYYFAESGAMATNWLSLDGKWYFLNPSGAMLTGNHIINGLSYYFYPNGVMSTGNVAADTMPEYEEIEETYSFSLYNGVIEGENYPMYEGLYHHDINYQEVANTSNYLGTSVRVVKEVRLASGRFAQIQLNGKNYWVLKEAIGRHDVAANFVEEIKKNVKDAVAPFDQFASIILAQAILESGYGKSTLASQYHNYFGIKAKNENEGPTVSLPTQEWDPIRQQYYTINGLFRRYESMAESFADRCRFMEKGGNTGNPNFYRPTFKSVAKTYQQATAYLSGRYATAPDYHVALNSLIAFWELDVFD